MKNQENSITVTCTVLAPLEKVWNYWTLPAHVMQWNQASDDWHTPHAENDLKVGGKFLYRMAAKDGSFTFDFEGIYDTVTPMQVIAYAIADGRKVRVEFAGDGAETTVTETFDPEEVNSRELQQGGWQAILNNFKRYVEQH